MKCLVVGTDRLGAAERILNEKYGVTEIIHWSGKKKHKGKIPDVSLIVVYAGFVNHNLAKKVKQMAKTRAIPIKHINRGLSELATGHA